MQTDYLELTIRYPQKMDFEVSELVAMADSIGAEIVSFDTLKEYLKTQSDWELVDVDELKAQEGADGATRDEILQRLYFPADAEGAKNLLHLKELIASSALPIDIVQETDVRNDRWALAWRDHYHPIEIGNTLVVPAWMEVPQDERVQVKIDPGMAFGTGTHETTSLVMEFIDEIDVLDKEVLDMGCGSGILAILLTKRGARKVLATDIDQDALEAAEMNAKINGIEIGDHFDVRHSDLFQEIEGTYDLICANLLADIVIRMLDEADLHLKKSGKLILSGILLEKQPKVEDKLNETGFVVTDTKQKGEWIAIEAIRKNEAT